MRLLIYLSKNQTCQWLSVYLPCLVCVLSRFWSQVAHLLVNNNNNNNNINNNHFKLTVFYIEVTEHFFGITKCFGWHGRLLFTLCGLCLMRRKQTQPLWWCLLQYKRTIVKTNTVIWLKEAETWGSVFPPPAHRGQQLHAYLNPFTQNWLNRKKLDWTPLDSLGQGFNWIEPDWSRLIVQCW